MRGRVCKDKFGWEWEEEREALGIWIVGSSKSRSGEGMRRFEPSGWAWGCWKGCGGALLVYISDRALWVVKKTGNRDS